MPGHTDRFDAAGRISRRGWLSALGLGGVTAVAGCADDADDAADAGDDPDDDSGAATGGAAEPDPIDLSGDPPPVEGTYHATQASAFDTINPIFNTESGAGAAIGYALDQGYTFDENDEVFPLLLRDIRTEDAGETWTIEFRDGLEFSDPYGRYTAGDYVYYVRNVHQAAWAPSANSADWQGVEVEQTGELEATATLDDPNIIWPETFAPLEYPIPQELLEPYVEAEDVEGLQQDEELLDLSFAGNLGAYTLDEWIRDGGTRYTRNDEYYLREVGRRDDALSLLGDAPYFEEARIEIIPEESGRIAALERGDTDNVQLPPDRGRQFIEDEETMVVLQPTPFNTILSVNMRDNGWTFGPGNLFRVTEFRQAIAAAIDKEQFIEGILNGFANEHVTWQPEFSEWFPGTDDLTMWGVPGDGVYGAEPARALAEEALDQVDEEYAYDGDTLVGPDGNQVELELYYNAASETQELAAEFFRNEFERNLGFTLSVNAIDGTTFSENYWSGTPAAEETRLVDTIDGEEVRWERPTPNNPGPRGVTSEEAWDLGTVLGLNTFPRNPLTNQVFFDGATSAYNPVGYYPEFDADAVFGSMRAADTREELADAVEDLFVALNEEQPYIMIAFGDDIQGYDPDLRGPIANFSSGFDFAGWHKRE